MHYTADHHGFYRNGRPFVPLIQDRGSEILPGSNIRVVRLPAQLRDDLDWSLCIEQAQHHIDLNKDILWEIDLGLASTPFIPEDTASFFSFTLALEEFSTKVWPRFQERTFGALLFRGKFSPHTSFPLSIWEVLFDNWEKESGKVSDYALYCAQNLAEYLHRLISFLPDTLLPFALFDVTSLSSAAKMAQLFSKERFEHTYLILKGAPSSFSGIAWEEGSFSQDCLGTFPISVGIYLPKDEWIDSSVLEEIDSMIVVLTQAKIHFRLIPEEKLTEQWDGLERLIIPSHAISPQGRRKLCGFTAAAGAVVTLDELLKI